MTFGIFKKLKEAAKKAGKFLNEKVLKPGLELIEKVDLDKVEPIAEAIDPKLGEAVRKAKPIKKKIDKIVPVVSKVMPPDYGRSNIQDILGPIPRKSVPKPYMKTPKPILVDYAGRQFTPRLKPQ